MKHGSIYIFSEVLGLVHGAFLLSVNRVPKEDQADVRFCQG